MGGNIPTGFIPGFWPMIIICNHHLKSGKLLMLYNWSNSIRYKNVIKLHSVFDYYHGSKYPGMEPRVWSYTTSKIWPCTPINDKPTHTHGLSPPWVEPQFEQYGCRGQLETYNLHDQSGYAGVHAPPTPIVKDKTAGFEQNAWLAVFEQFQSKVLTPWSMGGGAQRAVRPLTCGFCPLLKKSSCNTYLKILVFSLFIADAPIKIKSKNLVLPPRKALLGHPVQKYFKFF